jgi:hypothetical protein
LSKKQAYKDIIMTLVRGSNPIWFEVDLTAHAFDDTFWLFILENDIPYIPATVWQDPYGNVAWDNPIQFYANGTLPNNIYYDPDTVYRLEFRQGNTQEAPLIYLVENYVPGNSGNTPPDETSFVTDNQITNPQFALINFQSPLVLTAITTQVINIAPGWFLNLSGTGNVTLTQVLLNNSVPDSSNASYALRLQLSGWNNVYLSQRFKNNGVLWANTFVSSSIMALSGNPPENISATLVDSQGHSVSVLDTTSITAAFNPYPQVSAIPPSLDSDFPPTAYTEYQLLLPNNGDITITSIQLIDGGIEIEYPYEQTTIERQIDHTFNYYNGPLQFKPIPSLLTGWDFAVNPAQFGSPAITTTPAYIWDQTICASAVNTINVARITTSGAFSATTTVNNDAFYMLQYLTGADAFLTTLSNLAVNVSAYLLTHPGVTARVYLYYSNGGGTIPTLPTTIGTLAASGVFTLTASNWAIIPQNLGFSNTFTMLNTGTFTDLKSIGWNGTDFAGSSATANFAIVVTFAIPTAGTQVVVNSISCVPGDIASRPAPFSFDETLRRCQAYYEKSYAPGTAVGTANTENSLTFYQFATETNSTTNYMYQESFGFNWKQTKRITPTLSIFSTINANTNKVTANYVGYSSTGPTTYGSSGDVALGSYWTQNSIGSQGVNFTPTAVNLNAPCFSIATANGITAASAWLSFHYVADARLGVV